MCEYGGFDAATGTITPFAKFEPLGIYEVLDVIAASAEAGALDSDKWVSQIFANNDVFNAFMDEYSGYDECFRTCDRWYGALLRLSGLTDEEGFVSSAEIADRLREAAEETGQLN